MVKSSLKLLVIAASISVVGCASTSYNAGQQALENKRFTSESSLEAAEPSEDFSDAMKIMYDLSQVDVDYKNNLDTPYLTKRSGVKDAVQLGGTAALLLNGASALDATAFFFGTGHRKEISDAYTRNLIIRHTKVEKNASSEDLNKVILEARDQMSVMIQNALKVSGTDSLIIKDTDFSSDVREFEKVHAYILPEQNHSPTCEENFEALSSAIRKGGVFSISTNQCISQSTGFAQLRVGDTNNDSYIISVAVLPDSFPVEHIKSEHQGEYLYTPAYEWLEEAKELAQSLGKQSLFDHFEEGRFSMTPRLVDLQKNTSVPFKFEM
jgi:hypothetical protein